MWGERQLNPKTSQPSLPPCLAHFPVHTQVVQLLLNQHGQG